MARPMPRAAPVTTATFCAAVAKLPSRLVPHRHRARAELQPTHKLQVDILRQAFEQRWPMACQPGVHHELVLVDQPQLRQRQRELYASYEQSLTRLPLELLNRRPQIPSHQLRVPIGPLQRARHDVLLRRVDRAAEGFHPIGHLSSPRRLERCLHHFVSDPAKEESIRPIEVLDRVAMQVLVRENCSMIAAPVQCDIDGIPKGSHYVLLSELTPVPPG